uniref:Uncharacterized protein n=1 Tax=Arundo donax TaxID=35708 RepID=A0A0A9EYB2_ARUDO
MLTLRRKLEFSLDRLAPAGTMLLEAADDIIASTCWFCTCFLVRYRCAISSLSSRRCSISSLTFCTRASRRVRSLLRLRTRSRFLVLTFLVSSSRTGVACLSRSATLESRAEHTASRATSSTWNSNGSSRSAPVASLRQGT